MQASLLTVSDSWWVNTKPAVQRWDSQTLPPDRIGKIYLLTEKKIVLLVSLFMCTNLSCGFMLPYSNDAIIHAYQLFNHPLNCSIWQCETERFIFPWGWSVTKINFALHDSNTFFLSPKCHQCPVSCLLSFQLYTMYCQIAFALWYFFLKILLSFWYTPRILAMRSFPKREEFFRVTRRVTAGWCYHLLDVITSWRSPDALKCHLTRQICMTIPQCWFLDVTTSHQLPLLIRWWLCQLWTFWFFTNIAIPQFWKHGMSVHSLKRTKHRKPCQLDLPAM